MPWTVESPPNVAKNWTDDERRKCIAAANAALADGSSDETAIYACIAAAGKGRNTMDMSKQATVMTGLTYYRTMLVERIDDDSGTITAALSSEEPVKRPFGLETLAHSAESIDFSRAAQGLPLLWSHNHDQVVGRVRSITLDADSKLRGNLEFSKSARGQEIWRDVQDGILTDVSVGYRIEDYEEDGDSVLVTRWLPFEASVVAVGADAQAGIGRSAKEASTMPEAKEDKGAVEVPTEDIRVLDFEAARERNIEEGKRQALTEERKRIREIERVFGFAAYDGAKFKDLKQLCVERGVAVEKAKDLLLEMVGRQTAEIEISGDFIQSEEMPGLSRAEFDHIAGDGKRKGLMGATGGQTNLEKFREGALEAIMHRNGIAPLSEEQISKNEWVGYKLSELCRESLRVQGIRPHHDPYTMIGQALSRAAASQVAADFPQILRDAANKSLQVGYTQAPVTWNQWAQATNVPDFKTNYRPVLSAASDLEAIAGNEGEYKYGKFLDIEESYTVNTYGKLFSISRKTLIDDDLVALSTLPRSMGAAAARLPNTLAYGILTANAALGQDSVTLFHADHSNLVAPGSGAGPSITTLSAGFTAMALQQDPSSTAYLNLSPQYLLVPKALEVTARLLATSTNDPDQVSTDTGGGGTRPNPFNNRIVPVADALLDANDPLQWYLVASSQQVGTVEVGFLNGQQTPFLEQRDEWNVDGVSYKVRLDVGAKALDFRGIYENDGN